MTPEEIRLVEHVIAEVRTRPEFAERFYEHLFVAAPEVAHLFSDVEAQRTKLTDELSAMVAMITDLASLDERARDLGVRHRGYGVRSGHYRVARTVMGDTLAEVLGDDFGPTERAAWDRATSLITELMQAG